MAALPEPTLFTEKEYLALEGVAETKHEYSGGRILAMAGAEIEHNQIAQNVRAELMRSIDEDGPCRILSADQRVKVEATSEYYYPDVIVTCLEPRLVEPRPRSLLNPQVIVEVLSGSTAAHDQGTKWAAYQTIRTLTDYVLVSSTRRSVAHYRRRDDGSWELYMVAGGAVTLAAGMELDVARLYRLVSNLE
ncbi:MAG: Uma2 family endonuclease [Polyangiaceae bacterium]|nr:Uma2 family endonuclease [Polyangiaceae bacterium]